MSLTNLPPRMVAAIDQDRAELRQLVETVREHVDAEACDFPGTCSGPAVAAVLGEIKGRELRRLLALAVAELAALDYGLALFPTDAALAALERPEGGDDDDHR